jgi:hypothetical protein
VIGPDRRSRPSPASKRSGMATRTRTAPSTRVRERHVGVGRAVRCGRAHCRRPAALQVRRLRDVPWVDPR